VLDRHAAAATIVRALASLKREPVGLPIDVDRPKVTAVIDTSGSITPALLEQVGAELARLAADFAVTVVECDAAVHAVFFGYAMSMVLGHAPVILPAVLRVRLPHHRRDYAILALLHASFAMRILGGDLAGVDALRVLGGALGVVTLLAFVANAITSIAGAQRASAARRPGTTPSVHTGPPVKEQA